MVQLYKEGCIIDDDSYHEYIMGKDVSMFQFSNKTNLNEQQRFRSGKSIKCSSDPESSSFNDPQIY